MMIVEPRVSQSGYSGLDRAPWGAVLELYYTDRLESEEQIAFEKLRSGHESGYWWPLCRSLSSLAKWQTVLHRERVPFEVLGVYSRYLEACGLQSFLLPTPRSRLLGYDVLSVGEWSLLAALLESDSAVAKSAASKLNSNGLMDNCNSMHQIEGVYHLLEETNEVEEIASVESDLMDCVAIYSLDVLVDSKRSLID